MRDGFRQAITWLHNWAGLVVGWLLLTIAAAGTLSVFRQELDAWTHPELARGPIDQAAAGEAAIRWLSTHAATSPSWFLDLADARTPGTLAFYSTGKAFVWKVLSPLTGLPDGIRDSYGGEFFYRFHFELQLPYPWGRLAAVIAAEVMLVVLLSGIVAHRRIFKDFFTLRTGKGQRSWLDAHVVFGVLALPFHLMIALTGVVTLVTLFLPWGGLAAYKGDAAALSRDLYPSITRMKSDKPAPLAPVAPMLRTAMARFDGAGIATVSITNPGDAAAVVTVSSGERPGIAIAQHNFSFDGKTGRVLNEFVERRGAMRLHDTLYGLHMGRFAGLASRWLYFLSGCLLTAAIASGLILWTAKRRRPHGRGHRFVTRLNIGFIAGLPIAFSTFLLANRLLPLDLVDRATWEQRAVFIAWALALGYAALRSLDRVWREMLGFAAAACGAILLVDLLAWRLPGGAGALDGVTIGVDGVALVLAGLFAIAARKAAVART